MRATLLSPRRPEPGEQCVQLAYGEAQALDRVMYEEEVRREALSFEQQFHYGEGPCIRSLAPIACIACSSRACVQHLVQRVPAQHLWQAAIAATGTYGGYVRFGCRAVRLKPLNTDCHPVNITFCAWACRCLLCVHAAAGAGEKHLKDLLANIAVTDAACEWASTKEGWVSCQSGPKWKLLS